MYDVCVNISLKIWHCKFMIFVFDLGSLDYQYVTFYVYSLKFSANFIKMHECYLLSAECYL